MSKLTVKNFGPVKELELEIKDYCLFIGPQASGKSTIAKLVYYFLSLKDEVTQYVMDAVSKKRMISQVDVEVANVKKRLYVKFILLFGDIEDMHDFDISFQYKENYTFELCKGRLRVPRSFDAALSVILDETSTFISDKDSGQTDLIIQKNNLRNFYSEIEKNIYSMFGDDDCTTIYVPASRSILCNGFDHLTTRTSLDYAAKDFTERIMLLKKWYNRSLEDTIRERIQFSDSFVKVDSENLFRIKDIITKILRGEYRYNKEEERLYYNETDYVRLSLASSGQQEAVWILQLIFSLVLNNTKTTLLIEEPEAHLFPEAQKYIVWLISLFANLNGNRVIITTHSPYILSTANNLLYASKVGRQHPEETEEIIPSAYWIDYDKTGAYYVDKGTIESLLESDIKQIRAERIDEVSVDLNREFDNLLAIRSEEDDEV